jgi:hypothetical protein
MTEGVETQLIVCQVYKLGSTHHDFDLAESELLLYLCRRSTYT